MIEKYEFCPGTIHIMAEDVHNDTEVLTEGTPVVVLNQPQKTILLLRIIGKKYGK